MAKIQFVEDIFVPFRIMFSIWICSDTGSLFSFILPTNEYMSGCECSYSIFPVNSFLYLKKLYLKSKAISIMLNLLLKLRLLLVRVKAFFYTYSVLPFTSDVSMTAQQSLLTIKEVSKITQSAGT